MNEAFYNSHGDNNLYTNAGIGLFINNENKESINIIESRHVK